MNKALLIAEKPDLMRQIEAVYKAHRKEIPYEADFLSQRGHLAALMEPGELNDALREWSWETLPFQPEDYGGWKYKVIKEKKNGSFRTSQERYEEIRKSLKSGAYDFVIHAGDPDQEGELLVRVVLELAGNTLPVKRFWTNDLTENAVVDALVNLRDDDRDPMLRHLLDAAYGRQHSDYRFGMNLSRAATLKMGTVVSCGRVETPILSIVCRREDEIRGFKPVTTYGLEARYAEGFAGRLLRGQEAEENGDDGTAWFPDRKEPEALAAALPKKAVVSSVERKTVKTLAPKLFKLATAQVAAGKLGYNDADTLAVIQGLYEKKLLSYPRTDCEYLSSKEDFRALLDAAARVPELAPWVKKITDADIARVRKTKKWVSDKALEDAGHSALKPTDQAFDFSSLTREERDIYTMVAKRFVAIFLPPLVQEQTVVVADAGEKRFRTAGKTLVDKGYAELYGAEFTDAEVPRHEKGDVLEVREYAVTEKTTTCPKRFTSPDIIAACENPLKYLDDPALKALGKKLKIGTPATRSAIIRKLVDKYRYLQEKKEKKQTVLVPTPLGEGIVRNLGALDICKVDLTGEWEERLEDVRSGKLALDDLESEMKTGVAKLVEDMRRMPMKDLSEYAPQKKKKYAKIAPCPSCGGTILAGEKGCFCTNWKSGCKASILRGQWKAGLTDDDFATLMTGGEVHKTIETDGERTAAMLRFDVRKGGLYDAASPPETIGKCPVCGGDIMYGRDRFYCAGQVGKPCTVGGWLRICGAELAPADVTRLLEGGEIEKECSKDGDTWSQKLTYDIKASKVTFARKPRTPSEYTCPCCKKDKLYETEKMLKCGKCGFTIWKISAGHEFTSDEIRALVKNGKTDLIDGFLSKAGRAFSASVKVNRRTKKTEFDFSDGK